MVSGLIILWQIEEEEVEIVTNFIFLGSKVTTGSNCSQENKRCLLLGKKAMTNVDRILESSDITLPTDVCVVKAMVFSVVMSGYENWTIKKTECRRTDAFKLLCWRRLLRVPWKQDQTSHSERKSTLNICWKDSLKLKLQYFGHLMQRVNSLKKTLMLGKITGRGEGDDRGRDGWMASPTQQT